MKILIAAAIVLGVTFASVGPSSAMVVAPQDNPSLVQTIRDDCHAPQRNARCKWYGWPGVHRGPVWMRQHGGEGYRTHYHHKHYKHYKHPTHYKNTHT